MSEQVCVQCHTYVVCVLASFTGTPPPQGPGNKAVCLCLCLCSLAFILTCHDVLYMYMSHCLVDKYNMHHDHVCLYLT